MEDKLEKLFIKYPRLKDDPSSMKLIIFFSVMIIAIEMMSFDGFEVSESIKQFYLITSQFGGDFNCYCTLIPTLYHRYGERRTKSCRCLLQRH